MIFKTLQRKTPHIQSLNILSASNGCMVQAGCMTFVFTSGAELTRALGEYLADPDGFTREHGIFNAPPQPMFPNCGPMGAGLVGAAQVEAATRPLTAEERFEQMIEPTPEGRPIKGPEPEPMEEATPEQDG